MARRNDGGESWGRLDGVLASLAEAYSGGWPADEPSPIRSRRPDRRTLGRLAEGLPEVLFPGHFGCGPSSPGFDDRLARRVSWLRGTLTEQVARALRCQFGRESPPPGGYRRWSRVKVNDLLTGLPVIIRTLHQDVDAAYESDPASRDRHEIISTYPGMFAVAVYRVAHHLHVMGVPLVPRMLTEYAHSRTGIDIHPGALIGPGFFIDHGTGVVVGETTVIGRNVTLYQGVTLGALNFPKDENGDLLRGPGVKRHPTLEDNVVVYANASVLGGETVVGRNSRIGANVRLTESVGPEMLVRVDRPNFRVHPLRKSTQRPSRQRGEDIGVVEGTREVPPVAQPLDLDYEDRKALSRLADEGGANCGDVDELGWPPR